MKNSKNNKHIEIMAHSTNITYKIPHLSIEDYNKKSDKDPTTTILNLTKKGIPPLLRNDV